MTYLAKNSLNLCFCVQFLCLSRFYQGIVSSNPFEKSPQFFSIENFFNETCRQRLNIRQPCRYRQFFIKSDSDYENVHEQEKKEDVSKAILIWRAVKLPIYSVALIPLTVSMFNTSSSLFKLWCCVYKFCVYSAKNMNDVQLYPRIINKVINNYHNKHHPT